jgi:hypothetical protein
LYGIVIGFKTKTAIGHCKKYFVILLGNAVSLEHTTHIPCESFMHRKQACPSRGPGASQVKTSPAEFRRLQQVQKRVVVSTRAITGSPPCQAMPCQENQINPFVVNSMCFRQIKDQVFFSIFAMFVFSAMHRLDVPAQLDKLSRAQPKEQKRNQFNSDNT